jgi:hypothetical protein
MTLGDRATILRECGPTVGLSTLPDPIMARLDRLLLEVLALDAKVTRIEAAVAWQFLGTPSVPKVEG